jgi:hypothetical protein
MQRLRNQKGYILANWGAARVQLRCMICLPGALRNDKHAVTTALSAMLRRYE